jgi:flagellin-like protein
MGFHTQPRKHKIFIRSKRDALASLVSAGGQETKKSWLIRKDEEAVSPVIATILLVGITLILVSTLYVMVSSLLPGSTAGENTVDIAMSDNQDGNWTLTVSRMDSPGLLAKSVRLTIYNWSGVMKLNRVGLMDLTTANWPVNRAVYRCFASQCPIDTTVMSVGDTISVFMSDVQSNPKRWGYQSGYSYSLTAISALLATGRL